MAQKILFIDRDGTLVIEPHDLQLDSFEKLEFFPNVFYYLSKIVREFDFELVIVTNQDGLGTPSFPESTFWPVQNFMINAFSNENILFKEIFIDRSFAEEMANTRKPRTGLLTQYLNDPNCDLKNSFVIGDRYTDVELAKNLNAKAILINAQNNFIEERFVFEILLPDFNHVNQDVGVFESGLYEVLHRSLHFVSGLDDSRRI